MKNILSKYKITIITIVYLLGVFCLFFFAGKALLDSINNKRIEIEKRKADQEIKAKQISELPKLQEQLKEVKSNEEQLNFIIEREKALELIKEVEKIADQTRNEITINIPEKTIKIGDREDKETLLNTRVNDNFIEMNIELKGTFQSTLSFISKMEKLKYISDLVIFEIGRYEEEEEGVNDFLRRSNNQEEEEVEQEEETISNPVSAKLKFFFYLEKQQDED